MPTIVMGDFNARPDDPELKMIMDEHRGLRDVWRTAGRGSGVTIPAGVDGEPRDRIDYIVTSREFTLCTALVARQAEAPIASDHYPVVADVSLSELGQGAPKRHTAGMDVHAGR